MSVNMFLESADEQAAAIQSMCQARISEMEKVKEVIAQFTAETALKGQAYDSAKQYFEATYVPLANGFILLAEALQKAAKQLAEEYRAEVDGNSLHEDALRNQIRQLGDLIEESDMCFAPSSTALAGTGISANPFLPFYEDQKREIQEKLDKLMAYNGRSATLFTEVESLMTSVETGLREVGSGKGFNAGTGTFTIPSPDNLAWTTVIAKQVKQNNTQFLEEMRKKVPHLSETEKSKLFELAQTNSEIEPPQEIIDYFMNDVDEIPTSIKDSLPQDLVNAGVESSGKATQNFGFLLTTLTGKMGPGGAGNFVMVNPNTSSVTTSIIKTGSTIAKVGKFGLPIVGGIVDGVTQISQGEDVGDAVVKSVAHVGIGIAGGEAGAAIGGAIGTAIPIPVVGTLAGAALGFVVGVGITAVGNYIFDKIYDKKDKIIAGAKDIAEDVGKSIGEGVKSVGDKIGNAASGFMKGLGSVFG